MVEFVKEFYTKSTGNEWQERFEKRLSANLPKAYKKRALENIKYLRSIGLEDKKIATILVRAPELFLHEPNPQNNNSLDKKIKFFAAYGLKPESSLLVAHKLYEYELYDDSNARAIISALDKRIGDKNIVGKILYRYPNVLSIPADEIKDRLDFWAKQAAFIDVDLGDLLSRWPALLHYSVDPNNPKSVNNKFAFFKKRFHISDKELMEQVYKFPTFVGLDINPNKKGSVQAKIAKLNELGFGDITIAQNLRILTAPANKVKSRHIICKNFGVSKERFVSGVFMFHEKKLYARAKFIKAKNLPKYLLTATEVAFRIRTLRGTYKEFNYNGRVFIPLVEEYPLTEENMLAEQEKFNRDRKKAVELNDDEMAAVAVNVDAEAEEAAENLTYTYVVNYTDTDNEYNYNVDIFEKE